LGTAKFVSRSLNAEVHGSSSEVQNNREDMYSSRIDPHSSTTVTRSRTAVHFDITDAHDSIVDAHSSSMNVQGAAAPSTSSVSTLIGQRRHPGMFPFSWQRPHRGRVKCNVDTYFSAHY